MYDKPALELKKERKERKTEKQREERERESERKRARERARQRERERLSERRRERRRERKRKREKEKEKQKEKKKKKEKKRETERQSRQHLQLQNAVVNNISIHNSAILEHRKKQVKQIMEDSEYQIFSAPLRWCSFVKCLRRIYINTFEIEGIQT